MNNLNNLTFADLISAKIVSKFKALTKVHADVILVTAGIAYIALFAQFSILIPPVSPVVFTMQTFAVFSASAALGMRRALITNFGYMLLGSLGAPIFAGGSSGFGGVASAILLASSLRRQLLAFLVKKGSINQLLKHSECLLLLI